LDDSKVASIPAAGAPALGHERPFVLPA